MIRRATVLVLALAFAGVIGCGDDSTYVCETACNRLADRWDDCNLNPKVLPGGPGSEITSSRLCNQELGEDAGDNEQSKVNTCSRLAGKVEEWSQPGKAPATWLDAMKDLL